MTVSVRDFRPSDAEAAAAAGRQVVPFEVTTPATIAWQAAHAPAAQHFRLLVAELDGELVGTARTGLAFDSIEPGQAFANVTVVPAARRRGAGTALLDAAEERLAGHGARTVFSWVLDEEAGHAFAPARPSGAIAGRSRTQIRTRRRTPGGEPACALPEPPAAGPARRTAGDLPPAGPPGERATAAGRVAR